MRFLGLDVGSKRIGMALSDELLITAQGIDTLQRTVLTDDLRRIAELVTKEGVNEIVAGLPLNMDGTHSAQTKEVVGFLDALGKVTAVPIKTWDERLTSLQAERLMIAADLSRAKRKRLSDKLAAQYILQSYLDAYHRQKEQP